MNRKSRFACLIALLLVASACDRTTEIRHYTEISRFSGPNRSPDPHAGLRVDVPADMQTQDPAVQAMLDRSVAEVELRWAVPPGWTEERGAGMRLVTFTSQEADPVTCTVISLAGTSGGLEANALRWARQLGISLDDTGISDFLDGRDEITSAGGVNITVLDFRVLQPEAANDAPSMSAGIVTMEGKTVFIKMTGSLAAVNNNQSAFRSLLESLALP